jgi:hypothetical protein
MANYGQCKAQLRNGQRCQVVIESEGADFCPHHLRVADEHGPESVKNGSVPKRRALRVVEESRPAIVAPESLAMTTAAITPSSVRPMFAEAAAENVEQLTASLLEAAGSAVRPVWLTVECSTCGERSRVEAPLPDVRSRVAAIELLLREGLGRPPQAEEIRATAIPDSAEAVEQMSWNDLRFVFAAHFAAEISELRVVGGKALLRQRLAALSEEEREALQAALNEVAA